MFLILIFNGSVIVCDFGLLRGWEDNPPGQHHQFTWKYQVSSFDVNGFDCKMGC